MTDELPVLLAREVTLGRGRRVIYRSFTLSLGPGITMILGPNGTGKTTLLEHLVDPRDLLDGHLEFEGRVVGADLPLREYFAGLGFLPQKWGAYGGFTVRDVLRYSAWVKGRSSREARIAADRALATFGLESHSRTLVGRLSGGLQQRVGIAEAFVHDPALVLLDEPTVGLDPEQRSVTRRYLRAAADTAAIVVSTHLTDDVDAIADRVIVVADGAVLFDGTPAELAELGVAGEGRGSRAEDGYLAVIARGPVVAS